jgi:hypothetical protein
MISNWSGDILVVSALGKLGRKVKSQGQAGPWVLTHVIPATWEVEIRTITV